MVTRLLSVGLLLSLAEAAEDATTLEIAPGVRMPFVSDGIILDAQANHTGEVKGLDLFVKLGGRGVDTAWSYHNQPAVGKAIREASVAREEIFLTTKIECMGTAEAAYAAIELDLRCAAASVSGACLPQPASQRPPLTSLVWSFCRLLGLKQIDLVIIHAPYHGYGEPYSNCSKGPAGAAARRATWRGMEKAVKDGLTRTIGLSNFDVEYMNEIMEGAEIPPAVNQVGLASPLLSSTPLANHRQSARRRCSSSLGCLTTLAAMHGDY